MSSMPNLTQRIADRAALLLSGDFVRFGEASETIKAQTVEEAVRLAVRLEQLARRYVEE